MSRTIVIGDIHGCLDEFAELLAKVSHDSSSDRVLLAGDLVDRGPDSVAVVRMARGLGALSVMGNHDEKLVRYRRHEQKREADPSYVNPMRPLDQVRQSTYRELNELDWEYLCGMPKTLPVVDGWTLVHGGFEPGIPVADQKANVCYRCRYIDPVTGRMVSLEKGNFGAPAGSVYWTERWQGPERVIYGHHVHGLENVVSTPLTLGIDTGCCFGGNLTAAVFTDPGKPEIVQVRARRAYAEWHRRMETE